MGMIQRWAEAMAAQWRMIVFDVDGTLVRPKSGGEFRQKGHPEDWEYIAPRDEQVRALVAAGVTCALASNQGGVAFGLFDANEMRDVLWWTGVNIGIPADFVFYCFMHPKATINKFRGESIDRKPNEGMLNRAIERYRAEIDGGLLLKQCLMVGDREEDAKAAALAAIDYLHPDRFFALSEEEHSNG